MVGLYRAVRSAGVGHADAHRPSIVGDVRYRDPRQIETVEVDLMAEFLHSRVRHPVPLHNRLFVDRRTGVETGCGPMSPPVQEFIVTQTAENYNIM